MKHLAIAAAIAAGLFSAAPLAAQSYPEKPITVIIPFPPGGAVDTVSRLFGAAMQPDLGQPWIVEPRPGAAGTIASAYVADADPDGYTVLQTIQGFAIAPAMFENLPYDPEKLTPVIRLMEAPLLIVTGASSDHGSLMDFIDYAKANPGRTNYGSTGVGNPLHLTMERLKLGADMDVRMVPYSGDAELAQALAQGQVDIAALPISTAVGMLESGGIRALAVTGDETLEGMEDVPSLAELGFPGYTGSWQGLFVPTGTPDEVIERLRAAVDKALADDDVLQRLANIRMKPVGGAEDFPALVAEQTEQFNRLIEDTGIPKR